MTKEARELLKKVIDADGRIHFRRDKSFRGSVITVQWVAAIFRGAPAGMRLSRN